MEDRTDHEVPEVPIPTYLWEELKRSKEKGAYPWTYIRKPPLENSEDSQEKMKGKDGRSISPGKVKKRYFKVPNDQNTIIVPLHGESDEEINPDRYNDKGLILQESLDSESGIETQVGKKNIEIEGTFVSLHGDSDIEVNDINIEIDAPQESPILRKTPVEADQPSIDSNEDQKNKSESERSETNSQETESTRSISPINLPTVKIEEPDSDDADEESSGSSDEELVALQRYKERTERLAIDSNKIRPRSVSPSRISIKIPNENDSVIVPLHGDSDEELNPDRYVDKSLVVVEQLDDSGSGELKLKAEDRTPSAILLTLIDVEPPEEKPIKHERKVIKIPNEDAVIIPLHGDSDEEINPDRYENQNSEINSKSNSPSPVIEIPEEKTKGDRTYIKIPNEDAIIVPLHGDSDEEINPDRYEDKSLVFKEKNGQQEQEDHDGIYIGIADEQSQVQIGEVIAIDKNTFLIPLRSESDVNLSNARDESDIKTEDRISLSSRKYTEIIENSIEKQGKVRVRSSSGHRSKSPLIKEIFVTTSGSNELDLDESLKNAPAIKLRGDSLGIETIKVEKRKKSPKRSKSGGSKEEENKEVKTIQHRSRSPVKKFSNKKQNVDSLEKSVPVLESKDSIESAKYTDIIDLAVQKIKEENRTESPNRTRSLSPLIKEVFVTSPGNKELDLDNSLKNAPVKIIEGNSLGIETIKYEKRKKSPIRDKIKRGSIDSTKYTEVINKAKSDKEKERNQSPRTRSISPPIKEVFVSLPGNEELDLDQSLKDVPVKKIEGNSLGIQEIKVEKRKKSPLRSKSGERKNIEKTDSVESKKYTDIIDVAVKNAKSEERIDCQTPPDPLAREVFVNKPGSEEVDLDKKIKEAKLTEKNKPEITKSDSIQSDTKYTDIMTVAFENEKQIKPERTRSKSPVINEVYVTSPGSEIDLDKSIKNLSGESESIGIKEIRVEKRTKSPVKQGSVDSSKYTDVINKAVETKEKDRKRDPSTRSLSPVIKENELFVNTPGNEEVDLDDKKTIPNIPVTHRSRSPVKKFSKRNNESPTKYTDIIDVAYKTKNEKKPKERSKSLYTKIEEIFVTSQSTELDLDKILKNSKGHESVQVKVKTRSKSEVPLSVKLVEEFLKKGETQSQYVFERPKAKENSPKYTDIIDSCRKEDRKSVPRERSNTPAKNEIFVNSVGNELDLDNVLKDFPVTDSPGITEIKNEKITTNETLDESSSQSDSNTMIGMTDCTQSDLGIEYNNNVIKEAGRDHEYEPVNPKEPPPLAPILKVSDFEKSRMTPEKKIIKIQNDAVVVPLHGELEDENESYDKKENEEEFSYVDEKEVEGVEGLEALPKAKTGFQNRLKSQAGRFKNKLCKISRPKISLPEPPKIKLPHRPTIPTINFPDTPQFLREKPKFLTQKPKFLTEKPKFLTEKPEFLKGRQFHLPDRSKFKLPERFTFERKEKITHKQTKSNPSSLRRPLRDVVTFKTYPRFFTRKRREQERAQQMGRASLDTESSLPSTPPQRRKKKPWVETFKDIKYADDQKDEVVDEEGFEENTEPFHEPYVRGTLEIQAVPKAKGDSVSDIDSDKEIQSSGSSSVRRRAGVIEEIDSDEFFLRQKGLSREDMDVSRYLSEEIRDAFRSPKNALAHMDSEEYDEDFDAPKAPERNRSIKSNKDQTFNTFPMRPTRRKQSDPEFGSRDIFEKVKRTPRKYRSRSDTRYSNRSSLARSKSQGIDREQQQQPPLPPKRSSKSRSRSAAELDDEIVHKEMDAHGGYGVPVAPVRKSRSRGTSLADEDRTSRGADSTILPIDDMVGIELEKVDVVPLGASQGIDEDAAGYAIVMKEKKGKAPPRPPPPPSRHRRSQQFHIQSHINTIKNHGKHFFFTYPRRAMKSLKQPVRPVRNYSTLGPSRPPRRSRVFREPVYVDDVDDSMIEKHLESGDVIEKMKGRPLPAPPRPPRKTREDELITEEHTVVEFKISNEPEKIAQTVEMSQQTSFELAEVDVSIQTDPLPEGYVVEDSEFDSKYSEQQESREPTPPPLPERSIPSLMHSMHTFPVSFPEKLHLNELDVDKLTVNEITASKIISSEIEGSNLHVNDINSKGGNLVVNGIELPPDFIKNLVAQITAASPPKREITPQPQLRRVLTPPPPIVVQHTETLEQIEEASRASTTNYIPKPKTTKSKGRKSPTRVIDDSEDELAAVMPERELRERKEKHKRPDVKEPEKVEIIKKEQISLPLDPSAYQLVGQLLALWLKNITEGTGCFMNGINAMFPDGDKRRDAQTAAVILIIMLTALVLLGFGIDNTIHHHHWDFVPPR